MSFFEQPWQPIINWNTPAGLALVKLAKALPQERAWKIIVFGSSPLQLAIDPSFVSADVDIISSPDLDQYCETAGLLKGQAPVYIDLCTAAAFTASADWMIRAYSVTEQHVTFILPHPIDILVSKVKRLEEKDLNAFRLMQAKTGHPTEEELLIALRRVVDMYRPSFDEESEGNPRQNTQVLWQELFGKAIDVAQFIIGPALAERRKSYGAENYGFLDALARIGKPA
jgi:hypothetical protein